MRNLLYGLNIVFFCICCSCKNYTTVFDTKPVKLESKQTLKALLKEDQNLLTFVDHFNNDSIQVSINDEILFNNTVQTDPRIGAAKGISFPKKTKLVFVHVNNSTTLKIRNYPKYRLIYCYKKENAYKIMYTNTAILFY